ncbi:hypothetical protein TEA_014364 [Camellia sinensis var. sinensis]|uniref:Uncharacterized protein n=1 Tax=Camellia sinensis var. sinensis TaxID=542762 RepID=A0A4S4DSX1_CAMSN|nr:hypothetical protein TEA_014364 [Camellia sinensis var. sinensis]
MDSGVAHRYGFNISVVDSTLDKTILRLGRVEAPATSAPPATEAYKTHTSSLRHILRTESSSLLSKYIFECEYLTLSEPGFDDGQMTPDSVLELAGSLRTSSGSSGGAAGGVGCTATTEIVRKKRSGVPMFRAACRPVSGISVGLMNRRKGTPHRSPLY